MRSGHAEHRHVLRSSPCPALKVAAAAMDQSGRTALSQPLWKRAQERPSAHGWAKKTSTQPAYHEAGMGHMELRRGHRTGASCDDRQAGASGTSLRTYHTHAAADWADRQSARTVCRLQGCAQCSRAGRTVLHCAANHPVSTASHGTAQRHTVPRCDALTGISAQRAYTMSRPRPRP